MFVTMGQMYAWATKEYILWNMTIGQLIMYLNEGIRQKYPDSGKKQMKRAVEKSHEELKRIKEELRRTYGDIGNG